MELAIISVVAFISPLFGSFLSSYMKKKGENLATSEDIQSVTKKIEEIKSYFGNQTEELRAKLNISGKYISEFMAEKRQAYLEAYTALSYWGELCFSFRPSGIPWESKENIEITKKNFSEAFFKTNEKKAILSVYNEDVEYLKAHGETLMAILKLQHFIEKYLDTLETLEFQWKIKLDKSENKEEVYGEYLKRKSELNDMCRNQMGELSITIFPLRNALTLKMRNILKNMTDSYESGKIK